jgi:hypothetical protein
MAMISTARTKIKAEAGHPCLIPRKTLKRAETHPLLRIHPFISVYIVRIHLINELLKPNQIQDEIDHSEKFNIEGAILFLDFTKAFDSLEWSFMTKCLEQFGFKSSFIRWIRTI